VHSVGFITRIYHDARSSECQIRGTEKLRELKMSETSAPVHSEVYLLESNCTYLKRLLCSGQGMFAMNRAGSVYSEGPQDWRINLKTVNFANSR